MDIFIGLTEYKDLEGLTEELEKLGYITKWIDYKKKWTYLSTKIHGATEGDFHIHILEKGSKDYTGMILFRDYLRAHEEEKETYAKLKPTWARESQGISKVYADLKTGYIQTVLKKAKQKNY